MKEIIDGLAATMALPIYIQIALGTGYLGYLISRGGISHKDKARNILFASLSFSGASLLITCLIWILFPAMSYAWCLVSMALLPIILGIIWRKYAHCWAMKILWWLKISNSTEFPDLWSEVTQNSKVTYRQITVFLKNGDILSCNDIQDFKDAPLNLMRTDADGSVAIYVTHEKKAGEKKFAKVKNEAILDVDNKPFYYRLNYIPKSEIERVEFVTKHP